MWHSVGRDTRGNYVRSLKRWLNFCENNGYSASVTNIEALQKFMELLSGSMGASSLK